jgi:hypothetical protein
MPDYHTAPFDGIDVYLQRLRQSVRRRSRDGRAEEDWSQSRLQTVYNRVVRRRSAEDRRPGQPPIEHTFRLWIVYEPAQFHFYVMLHHTCAYLGSVVHTVPWYAAIPVPPTVTRTFLSRLPRLPLATLLFAMRAAHDDQLLQQLRHIQAYVRLVIQRSRSSYMRRCMEAAGHLLPPELWRDHIWPFCGAVNKT